MNNFKLLSIDESGKASYTHYSTLFVLSGVIIPEKLKDKVDKKIRKIKKKFFKDEELIFHSRDMYRKKGPFSVLGDAKLEKLFWSEFISIINYPEISLIFIISEKNKAQKAGWQPKTILKKSYLRLLELFLIQLTKDQSKGKILSESDPSEDMYLIEAHNVMQSQNQKYRDNITSISLVKKTNLDVDIQIADALAPIAGMIHSGSKPRNSIEKVKN